MIKFSLGALALMLIFESLLPLLVPQKWRSLMIKLLQQDEKNIRFFACVIFSLGAILWYLVAGTDLFT